MSSIIKVNEIQDGGGNTILSSDGSGNVTQTRTGITEVDMWRLTTNLSITGDATDDITANLERVDTNNFSKIGTGMTESSGIFTFPSTGIYQISATGTVYGGLDINYFHFDISTTTDNSTYTSSQATNNHTHNGKFGQATGLIIFDVTNTSTHKVKFRIYHSNSGTVQGSTTKMATFFKFIKLGDT